MSKFEWIMLTLLASVLLSALAYAGGWILGYSGAVSELTDNSLTFATATVAL